MTCADNARPLGFEGTPARATTDGHGVWPAEPDAQPRSPFRQPPCCTRPWTALSGPAAKGEVAARGLHRRIFRAHERASLRRVESRQRWGRSEAGQRSNKVGGKEKKGARSCEHPSLAPGPTEAGVRGAAGVQASSGSAKTWCSQAPVRLACPCSARAALQEPEEGSLCLLAFFPRPTSRPSVPLSSFSRLPSDPGKLPRPRCLSLTSGSESPLPPGLLLPPRSDLSLTHRPLPCLAATSSPSAPCSRSSTPTTLVPTTCVSPVAGSTNRVDADLVRLLCYRLPTRSRPRSRPSR